MATGTALNFQHFSEYVLTVLTVEHTPQLTFHGLEVNIQAAQFACFDYCKYPKGRKLVSKNVNR